MCSYFPQMRAFSLMVILCCFHAAHPADATAQRAVLGVDVGGGRIELAIRSLSGASAIQGLNTRGLKWQEARPGMSWTELELDAGALHIPVRAIVARVDPKGYRFHLQTATRANRVTGAWTVDSAGSDAALAVNAGQFKEAGPWGWLVRHGVEASLPGQGALAVAIAFDTAGNVHWLSGGKLNAARQDPSIAEAFQSYPQLLREGLVPPAALDGRSVDHGHRDARLILAETYSGELLFVLTRLDFLGKTTQRVPIGLTFPESVILLRALGARNAVMLDGGISAQMMVRDNNGTSLRWPGIRAVPVGLVAVPR